MKTILKWFWFLNKRLYRKPAFLILMAVVPVCVLVLSFAAARDSGFLHIALGQEDLQDPISSEIVAALQQENTLIRFTVTDSAAAAQKMVRTGQADVAWIFPGDMQQKIDTFLGNKTRRNAVVRVVERETTVFSRIAQEKLVSEMYGYFAKAQYLRHIRTSYEDLETISDEQLLEVYGSVALSEDLFVFEDVEGNARQSPSGNYLTAPIRGLLATLICLSAGAATVFFMRDEQLGTFSLVKESRRLPVALGCVMIAALNMSVMAVIALGASGLLGNMASELLAMVLYCACCAGFWLLLKELLGSIKRMCAVIPILLLAMVALCPVFVQFGFTQKVGYLLPPTYLICSGQGWRYLLYMAGYAGGLLGITALLQTLKNRKRKV